MKKHKKSLFIEPFVGAANVSLNFKAEKYIWNDYNKDLIDSYDVMFSNAKEYINKCEELFLGGFGEYYKIRDIFNKEKNIRYITTRTNEYKIIKQKKEILCQVA